MAECPGAPLGNAVNAGVGIFKDHTVVRDWIAFTDHVEPDPERHAFYQKLYNV